MVDIIDSGLEGPGMKWVLEMDKKELNNSSCGYCGSPIKRGQMIYLCENCRKKAHQDCFTKNRDSLNNSCCKQVDGNQYFCGIVRLQKKEKKKDNV